MGKALSILVAVAMLASATGDDCCERLEIEQMLRQAALAEIQVLEERLAEEHTARRIAEVELERQHALVRQLRKQLPAKKTASPKEDTKPRQFELTRIAGKRYGMGLRGGAMVSITVKLRNISGRRIKYCYLIVRAFDTDGDLIRLISKELTKSGGMQSMIADNFGDGAVRVFYPWVSYDEYERLGEVTFEVRGVTYAP